MIRKTTIDEIVSLIRHHDLFIFVGAGISIAKPSSLLTFRELQNQMIWALCHNLEPLLKDSYRPIYNAINSEEYNDPTVFKLLNVPPEYLFMLCKKGIMTNDSEKYLALEPLNALRGDHPNQNHLILANLLLRGYIPAIFTTNFDLLIESAIKRVTSRKRRSINRCWRIEQFIKASGKTPALFKLHGSVDDLDSIVISLDEIGKRAALGKLNLLQSFLENHYVLFSGYRGADIDIFGYLASTKCKGIIWNARFENSIIPKIRKLLDIKNASLIVGDTGYVFKQILKSLNIIVPRVEENNSANRVEVLERYYESFVRWADKIEISSKLAIVGDLWEYIGEWEKAIIFFNSGLKMADNSNDIYMKDHFLGELAGLFYNIGKYQEAWNYCIILQSNAEKLPPARRLPTYIDTLQLMGLIEARSDAKKGYNYIMQSLDYQEQLEEIDHEFRYEKSRILINAGSILHNTKHLDEAAECYKRALPICDEFGDIRGRATILENLGSIFLAQERYDECFSLYGDAEYLFYETGDLSYLSKFLLNLAKAYYRKDIKKKARELAQIAMEYFRILSDKENLKIAQQLFNACE